MCSSPLKRVNWLLYYFILSRREVTSLYSVQFTAEERHLPCRLFFNIFRSVMYLVQHLFLLNRLSSISSSGKRSFCTCQLNLYINICSVCPTICQHIRGKMASCCQSIARHLICCLPFLQAAKNVLTVFFKQPRGTANDRSYNLIVECVFGQYFSLE